MTALYGVQELTASICPVDVAVGVEALVHEHQVERFVLKAPVS